jgi:hypothetical protein
MPTRKDVEEELKKLKAEIASMAAAAKAGATVDAKMKKLAESARKLKGEAVKDADYDA